MMTPPREPVHRLLSLAEFIAAAASARVAGEWIAASMVRWTGDQWILDVRAMSSAWIASAVVPLLILAAARTFRVSRRSLSGPQRRGMIGWLALVAVILVGRGGWAFTEWIEAEGVAREWWSAAPASWSEEAGGRVRWIGISVDALTMIMRAAVFPMVLARGLGARGAMTVVLAAELAPLVTSGSIAGGLLGLSFSIFYVLPLALFALHSRGWSLPVVAVLATVRPLPEGWANLEMALGLLALLAGAGWIRHVLVGALRPSVWRRRPIELPVFAGLAAIFAVTREDIGAEVLWFVGALLVWIAFAIDERFRGRLPASRRIEDLDF
ncbi:MAG: hypothetical protein R3F20_18080 [Planctomycetota bacterium]